MEDWVIEVASIGTSSLWSHCAALNKYQLGMLVLCIRVLHEVMESIPSSDGVILITFLCKLCSVSLLDTIANYKNSCLGLRILSINALHDAVETGNKYKAVASAYTP